VWTPDTEGIDHINAYSKSRTELGRLLSNFAHTPFTCKDGQFASIEAYWYWLVACTHPSREELRPLWGFRAKQFGRKLACGNYRDDEEFQQKIHKACWRKILSHQQLKELLQESSLPIVHYYAYGSPTIVKIPERGEWVWAWYEKARAYLKEHTKEDD
jgi:predicted NAD-dependent protein-ADP-ribosyltransferase YbiA (DUF1768 family)